MSGRKSKTELFIDTSYRPRNRVLYFRVSKWERERYEAQAKEQGLSLSELIRQGLELVCDRQPERGRVLADALPESVLRMSASD